VFKLRGKEGDRRKESTAAQRVLLVGTYPILVSVGMTLGVKAKPRKTMRPSDPRKQNDWDTFFLLGNLSLRGILREMNKRYTTQTTCFALGL